MEQRAQQKERPPSYYTSHNPGELELPSVPQTDLGLQYGHPELTLPDLRSVLSPEFQAAAALHTTLQHGRAAHESPTSTRSLPKLDAFYANGPRKSTEVTMKSPSEAGSVMSVDEGNGRSSSVSMDDPDVRIAAEALSGLGNPGTSPTRCSRCFPMLTFEADFIRSPTRHPSHMHSHASFSLGARASSLHQEPEPLFELLAQAHPWVHGTINGSLTAYAATKNSSPRIVQYSANLVERNITVPVASTVSSVGRMTGVESGLRRYLAGNRSSSDLERPESGVNKRRRVMDDDMDVESGLITPTAHRRDSQDSREPLPAYRASKPPSYREASSPPAIEGTQQANDEQDQRAWASQFAGQVFVMTSGLGVALSERSRQSLGFCLTLLGQSAQHVTNVMEALKLVLEEYDRGRESWHHGDVDSSVEQGDRPRTPERSDAARRLAEIIKRHSADIWSTLRNVVSSVSTQAGGALPDNARQFVRTQLLSLPQRWRVVSTQEVGDSETSRSAHRMIEFAKEGLDMMSQVSQVMKATLDSAERWLERVGRRRALPDTPFGTMEKDQEMGDVEPQDQQHHQQQQQQQHYYYAEKY